MKALVVACSALAVCGLLLSCGDDYEGGGRQNTLPGATAPERDAAPDVEEEPAQESPEDTRDS